MSKRSNKVVQVSNKPFSIFNDFFYLCPDALSNVLQFARYNAIFNFASTCKDFYDFIASEKGCFQFAWFIPSMERLCLKGDTLKVYDFPRFPQLKDFFLNYQFTEETFLKNAMTESDKSLERKREILQIIRHMQDMIRFSSFLPPLGALNPFRQLRLNRAQFRTEANVRRAETLTNLFCQR